MLSDNFGSLVIRLLVDEISSVTRELGPVAVRICFYVESKLLRSYQIIAGLWDVG